MSAGDQKAEPRPDLIFDDNRLLPLVIAASVARKWLFVFEAGVFLSAFVCFFWSEHSRFYPHGACAGWCWIGRAAQRETKFLLQLETRRPT